MNLCVPGSLRLVCLPYAGGTARAYRDLPAPVPGVEILPLELPGHGTRFGEPAARGLRTLAAQLRDDVVALGHPVTLFGHSMGALLAYEIARLLPRAGPGAPLAVAVCGYRAPHLPASVAPIHDLPDAQFEAALRGLGGTPAAFFDQPELLELFLPVLRADFAMCEDYAYVPAPPLPCPIVALTGREDHLVTPWEMQSWGECTTGPFTVLDLPGGHFFPWQPESGFGDVLAAALGAVVGESAAVT